jgi:thiol:disulfide interchange protein/DsbC/DsbD-like thiol-disulfide interchange protein
MDHPMKILFQYLLTAILLLCSGLSVAESEGRFISASWFLAALPTPETGEVTVGYTLTPKQGWHIYWENPGESGYAPETLWHDADAQPLQHPAPSLYELGGIPSYIHSDEVTLLQQVILRDRVTSLKADLELLVCSDSRCVPETLTFENAIEDMKISHERAQYAGALLPTVVRGVISGEEQGQVLKVRLQDVALPYITDVRLFPADNSLFSAHHPQTWRLEENDLLITVFRDAIQNTTNQSIVAVVTFDNGERASYTLPPVRPIEDLPKIDPIEQVSWWWAIVAAIIGGILLNLMPCVFPVLSLKIFALTMSGSNAQQAKKEAVAYTAGTILSVTALGGLILVLRASGEVMGWAFQLQNVYVLFGLYALMLTLTVNLVGGFELPSVNVSGQPDHGYLGAFSTGVLAAFVATPCTGPFMAGALGAALVMPPVFGLAIFSGLGLGLGLPFLMLAFNESLRRRLPAPGPWMETLKRFLAIPLALTALGLVWIMWRQLEQTSLGLLLLFSVIFVLVLCAYGSAQRRRSLTWPLWLGAAFSVIICMTFLKPLATEDSNSQFDEGALAQALESGRPTLLYFTADWCLTCKVNEMTSIDTEEVRNAFAKYNVNIIVADWTRGDKAITEYLSKEGAAGVPLYIWYSRNGQKHLLPQVLTSQMLIDLAAGS